jgi:hypothetical protein
LHDERLHNSYFTKYSYNDQVKEDVIGGHVPRMGDKRNAYRVLVGKPEGKKQLGRY